MTQESRWIHQARTLDPRALAEIYDHYSPGLYKYALRLLGDADVAEDCVAESFSRFLRAVHQGGGPKQYLQAYLYRIAHNWVTDWFRRNQQPEEPLEADQRVDPAPGPDQVASDRLDQARVRAALATLTPDQRQVVVLKFLEGWSNLEIAESMEKTVGAVKALQNRALSALKRQLTRQEEVA